MSDLAVSAAIGAQDKFSGPLGKMMQGMKKFGLAGEEGFGRAGKASEKFGEIFHRTLDYFSSYKIIEAGYEAIKSIPEQLNSFVEKGNEIAHTSQIIGMTAESFQQLAYAAKMQDINQNDVVTSMQKLNNNMGQLRVGTGALFTTVARINPQLAAQLMHTKDSTSAMLLLSDALKGTTNAQARAAIAQAAFGRSGQVMLPLLLEGSAGIQKLMGEANKYGDVLSNSVVEQTLVADDSLKKIRATMANIKDQILGGLLVKLQPLIDAFQKWITANRDLLAQRVSEYIEKIISVGRILIPVIKTFFSVVGWLLDHMWAVVAAYIAWTGAQIALNIAMDANPIGLITLAIEGLIATVALVIMYWHQITDALKSAWTWFTNLYDKSMLLRTALFFLASPIWLVVNAVRSLIDLISGKGLAESLSHLIPPWLQGIIQGGEHLLGIGGGAPNAPNAHGAVNVYNNIDNTAAPGVTSSISTRTAPGLTGAQGRQYAGGL